MHIFETDFCYLDPLFYLYMSLDLLRFGNSKLQYSPSCVNCKFTDPGSLKSIDYSKPTLFLLNVFIALKGT